MNTTELLSRELEFLRRMLVLLNTNSYAEVKECLDTEIKVIELLLQAE